MVRAFRRSLSCLPLLLAAGLNFNCSNIAGSNAEDVDRVVETVGQACVSAKYEGHDYLFCQGAKSSEDARAKCAAAGLAPVTIDDARENEFIRRSIGGDAFLGLTDVKMKGAWKWISDGRLGFCSDSNLQPSGSFAHWAPNQPKRTKCEYLKDRDRAYWFCQEPASWAEAKEACEKVGMSLASVHDLSEDHFIREHAKNGVIWLGGSDLPNAGNWKWVQDDLLFWSSKKGHVRGMLANWAPGHPSMAQNRHCLKAGHEDRWETERCEEKHSWVCSGKLPIQNLEMPDVNRCSVIKKGSGFWDSVQCSQPGRYICESPSHTATKSLNDLTTIIRDDYRTGRPRVSHVEFRRDAAVEDPFLGNFDRLGMRDCLDALVPFGAPHKIAGKDLEEVDYRQHFREYLYKLEAIRLSEMPLARS